MTNSTFRTQFGVALALAFATASGPLRAAEPRPGERLERRGDEIVVCGQLYHTTAPVVLWMDPGGYDAYRVERRFAPLDKAGWDESKGEALKSPNRYGLRKGQALTPEQLERVRGGGWDLPLLQSVVDQFVLHFDAAGTSRRCFEVLHDQRDLSVHFMLDLDGTIYQTLDLKERAWHATAANTRSVGIEIANIGAYPIDRPGPFDAWYRREGGRVQLVNPALQGLRDSHTPLHPAREEPVVGNVQGKELRQYDFTAPQYTALIRLTATLCALFPKIRCDYPRDETGKLRLAKLPDAELLQYHGILGHYHIQTNKVDPGPAFQWDLLVNGVHALQKKPTGNP
ncbi:MAG: peptidoglycan recognition family protein [Isosphaeraceae bacterium]|nr:peptidoglycan recognition family protein [Isosphaeraceae bacterium]